MALTYKGKHKLVFTKAYYGGPLNICRKRQGTLHLALRLSSLSFYLIRLGDRKLSS